MTSRSADKHTFLSKAQWMPSISPFTRFLAVTFTTAWLGHTLRVHLSCIVWCLTQTLHALLTGVYASFWNVLSHAVHAYFCTPFVSQLLTACSLTWLFCAPYSNMFWVLAHLTAKSVDTRWMDPSFFPQAGFYTISDTRLLLIYIRRCVHTYIS